jgi:hypothetical protein
MSKEPCVFKIKDLLFQTFLLLGTSGIVIASAELLALISCAIYIKVIKILEFTTKGIPEDFLKSVISQKRAM